MQRDLYVFIDESGNFDFSPRGSRYFSVTAFVTSDPASGRERFLRLKYELLAQGSDQESFHATEDRQHVRDAVFRLVSALGPEAEVHSVVADKRKAYPGLYQETIVRKGRAVTVKKDARIYQLLCQTLLGYIFRGKEGHDGSIVVVLGSLFTGEAKRAVFRTVKRYLKDNFPKARFEVYCHASHSDINCQIADYCSWAIAIKRERGEERPYGVIAPMVKSEFEIFAKGTRLFY